MASPYQIYAGNAAASTTVPVSTSAGDGIVAMFNVISTTGMTLSDSQGNTYLLVSNNTSQAVAMWAATYHGSPGTPTVPLASGTDSIIATGGTIGTGSLTVTGVPGVAAEAPDASPAFTNGNSGTATGSSTGTLGPAGDTIVMGVAGTWSSNAAGVSTWGGSFAEVAQYATTGTGSAMAWEVVSGTAPVTPAATMASSEIWIVFSVALTPASTALAPRCYLTGAATSASISPALTGWANARTGIVGTAPAAGDLVVIAITIQGTQTPTQTAGTGTWAFQYTGDANGNATAPFGSSIAWRVLDGTETAPTFTWAGSSRVAWVAAAVAPTPGGPVVSAGAWGTPRHDATASTTHTAGPVTASGSADCVLVIDGAVPGAVGANAVTFTAPAGFSGVLTGGGAGGANSFGTGTSVSFLAGQAGTVTPGAQTIEGGATPTGATFCNLYTLAVTQSGFAGAASAGAGACGATAAILTPATASGSGAVPGVPTVAAPASAAGTGVGLAQPRVSVPATAAGAGAASSGVQLAGTLSVTATLAGGGSAAAHGVIPGPRMSTLSDAFGGTSINATLWTPASAGDGTATESGGTLNLDAPGSLDWATVSTNVAYDITGGSVFAQVDPGSAATSGSSLEGGIYLSPSQATSAPAEFSGLPNWARAVVTSGNLDMHGYDGSAETGTSIPYDATAMAWLRIRESAGTVFFDTSPDGSTWTNQASCTGTQTGLALTNVYVVLESYDNAAVLPAGTVSFDNLNLAGGPIVGTANIAGGGQALASPQTRVSASPAGAGRTAVQAARPAAAAIAGGGSASARTSGRPAAAGAGAAAATATVQARAAAAGAGATAARHGAASVEIELAPVGATQAFAQLASGQLRLQAGPSQVLAAAGGSAATMRVADMVIDRPN